jgi:integrase
VDGMIRHPRPPVPAHLTSMINSFELSLKAEGRSAKTITVYTDAARWLAGSLPAGVQWEDAARDVVHLRTFLAGLVERGYAISTRNQVGRSLQQFFKWLAAEEDLPVPFGPKLKVPPAPKLGQSKVPVLTTEQLVALIRDAEKGKGFECRRDAAILRLFACTGSRLAELTGVALSDLNLPAREVTVTGKGDETRTVRIDNPTALALDRYLRVRAQHRYAPRLTGLWVGTRRKTPMTTNGIYQVIKRRATRLGITLHPHMFRHTFAHRWLDAGGAEGDLMALAGWKSGQMLRHYGASARGARARRAFDRVNFLDGV